MVAKIDTISSNGKTFQTAIMSGGELLQINPFGFIIATARRLWMVPR